MNAYTLNKKLYIPQLLIIAGNARNVGKTTLATQLISAFAAKYGIVAFKVSTIKPKDDLWHGHHGEPVPETYIINEETGYNGTKDTGRMLAAGASRAFYIRTREAYISIAMEEFLSRIPNDCMLICESRSLGEFVKPGLLVVLHKQGNVVGIKDITELEAKADLRIFIPENTFFPEETKLLFYIDKGKWVYSTTVP